MWATQSRISRRIWSERPWGLLQTGPAEKDEARMTSRSCPECDQPLPRGGYSAAVLASDLLDVRDELAAVDPSAMKLGFCDRGVELARFIHASAHRSGTIPGKRRKAAKRWLRRQTRGWASGSPPGGNGYSTRAHGPRRVSGSA